jgi:glutathione S-transferase
MRVSTPTIEHQMVRLAFPLVRAVMRRAMRVDAVHAARSRDKVHAVFNEVGKRLADGRPYLTGDRFSIADIAFAALASVLLLPDHHPLRAMATTLKPPQGLVEETIAFRETPAGQFVSRVYREDRDG